MGALVFRSVLGPHSDHDRPRLRRLLGAALPSEWRINRTGKRETRDRQCQAQELAANLKSRIRFCAVPARQPETQIRMQTLNQENQELATIS